MRFALLGPPSCGKGTQAEKLAQRCGVPAVSTGDLLRDEMRRATDFGRRIADHMRRGELIADDWMRDLLADHLADAECAAGFVLDGYPRNLSQARQLDELGRAAGWSLDRALLMVVDDAVVIDRAAGRRVCRSALCGAIFHVRHRPPQRAGVCDRCGAELIQRDDDQSETVRHRLTVYHQTMSPVADFYRKRGLLVEVAADASTECVTERIFAALLDRPIALVGSDPSRDDGAGK